MRRMYSSAKLTNRSSLKQSFGSGLREMCRTGFSVLRLAVR